MNALKSNVSGSGKQDVVRIPAYPVESWTRRIRSVMSMLSSWQESVRTLPASAQRRRVVAEAVTLMDREIDSLSELISSHAGAVLRYDSKEVAQIETHLSAVEASALRFDRAMQTVLCISVAA